MKKGNWFDFKPAYISGGGYFIRYMVALIILFPFILPGIWLIASTIYKRGYSLGWHKDTSLLITIIFILLLFAIFISSIVSKQNLSLIFQLPVTIIHLTLWMQDGDLSIKNQHLKRDIIASE